MTRFPASGGGSGPPYTYVMDGYPSDAEEGESLYHVTEDAAYVYTGSSWVEQTVTNHGQLAGVSAADHHSRYTDTEAQSAVHDRPTSTQQASGGTHRQYISLGIENSSPQIGSYVERVSFSSTYDSTDQVNYTINGFGGTIESGSFGANSGTVVSVNELVDTISGGYQVVLDWVEVPSGQNHTHPI